jgi:hypothetical protein
MNQAPSYRSRRLRESPTPMCSVSRSSRNTSTAHTSLTRPRFSWPATRGHQTFCLPPSATNSCRADVCRTGVGGGHVFHLPYYLEWAQKAPLDEFERAFMSGALIALGDALAAHGYFDHGPELELVRHLRNGVAHGNRFNITKTGRDRLAKWPAHNRLAQVRSSIFEVTPALNGQEVLWSYIERGDVLNLFQTVSFYLSGLAKGDPPRV